MLDLDLKNGINPLKNWTLTELSKSSVFAAKRQTLPSPPVSCWLLAHSVYSTVSIYRLFGAKTLDFERSVKVQFWRDWPHFLGQDQAWSEPQLVNFIQWSEFSKYLARALKVELFDFSQQELIYKKISSFKFICRGKYDNGVLVSGRGCKVISSKVLQYRKEEKYFIKSSQAWYCNIRKEEKYFIWSSQARYCNIRKEEKYFM